MIWLLSDTVYTVGIVFDSHHCSFAIRRRGIQCRADLFPLLPSGESVFTAAFHCMSMPTLHHHHHYSLVSSSSISIDQFLWQLPVKYLVGEDVLLQLDEADYGRLVAAVRDLLPYAQR